MLELVAMAVNIFGRLIPDEGKIAEFKAQLAQAAIDAEAAKVKASAEIISSENASGNWLASSWRPLTMYVFLAFLVSAWFGYVPPHMPDVMLVEIFSLIKIGLGGYIGGRTIEKSVGALRDVFKR